MPELRVTGVILRGVIGIEESLVDWERSLVKGSLVEESLVKESLLEESLVEESLVWRSHW